MLDRESCERRVYRLAVVLTGNPNSAVCVIEKVVGAQPDLRRLDNAHMDRLTVLRSREIRPASIVDDEIPLEIAHAIFSLSPQQREAWVFSRMYQLPEREMARAMDCSVTATQRHIQLAESALAGRLGKYSSDDAARILLEWTLKLEVPAFYREAQRRRLLRRRAVVFALVVVGAALVAGVVIFLMNFQSQ